MKTIRFNLSALIVLTLFALLASIPALAATDNPVDLVSLFAMWSTLTWVGKTVSILLMAHPAIGVLVALTKTPVDDSLYSFIYNKLLRPFALNISRATEAGPEKYERPHKPL